MEWFDLMDATGRKTGEKKEREAVHRDGDWHQSVHVWVIRNGEVLLQKRAADKECFPGCWDAACTGHVSAGEDILEGALRELREEIGVQAKPEALRYLFTQQLCVHSGAFCSNECGTTSFCWIPRNFRKSCSFSGKKFLQSNGWTPRCSGSGF